MAATNSPSTATRLALFFGGVVVVFGLGAAVGRLAGPIDVGPAPTSHTGTNHTGSP